MARTSGTQRTDNEKLSELVRKVKDGGDQDAFQQVVKALHAFLMHLSNRKFYRIPGQGSDDIYQEGLYALSTKAIPDYQEGKGAFLSFAKLCIRRHIITVLKSANNGKNRVLNGSISLDATARDDKDDGPVSVAGIIPAQGEHVLEMLMRNESHKNLKAMLFARLTPLEATIISCYLKNMSYHDIVSSINKRRKKKNKIGTKVADNALVRIRKKSADLLEEIRQGKNSP
jgi:RNA polymerase sporulation-specific sigma factor